MGGLLNDEGVDGATAFDESEAEGLIPDHLTSRAQLNEWEQANILRATTWARSSRGPDPLTIDGLRELHRRMFDRTWDWAGTFRTTDKNIGVPAARVWVALREVVDDVRFWIDHDTVPLREAAARFHHRLVKTHPFPNGNGRWAREATDLLLDRNGERPFDWGQRLADTGAARVAYIAALRSADRDDYAPLFRLLRVEWSE